MTCKILRVLCRNIHLVIFQISKYTNKKFINKGMFDIIFSKAASEHLDIKVSIFGMYCITYICNKSTGLVSQL